MSYGYLSEYKERLITTLEDLKRALKEDDKVYVQILLELLERDIINKYRR